MEVGGQEVQGASDDELRGRVRALGVSDTDSMGRGKLIDELFGELVEPKLVLGAAGEITGIVP